MAKRRVGIFALLLIIVAIGLFAASFAFIPHSVRLYIASTATCQHLDQALKESADAQFEGIKLWEVPLARLYRIKYWYLGGPTKVDDWAAGESSVFTVFLTAADSTGGLCDSEILELQQRFIDGSRSLDDYDETGYTVLHQAIIFHKQEFVKAYLNGGADRWLVVRSDNEKTNNKTAVELAVTLANYEFSPPVADRIAEMLQTTQ
ncbi:MAG: ankyrin repeat domain-containing protein [Woeseiaceae bacterium]